MSKWLSFVVMLAVLGFGLAPAQAAKGNKQKKDADQVFKKRDKDADGKLSQSEFVGKRKGDKATAAEKKFKAKDADKDGSLTLDEFKSKAKKS